MKLLVFCHEFPPLGGGAGNALYHLAREWVRAGNEVTVVTSYAPGFNLDETRDGIRIRRIPVGRKWTYRGRIIEMIRYILETCRRVKSFYESERPDLCAAFFTIPAGPAPYLMKRRYGVPFITYLRGGDVPGFWGSSLKWFHAFTDLIIKKIWKESALVISNSPGLAALARKLTPSLKVDVIPNGVDHRAFFPEAGKRDSGPMKMLFVGRLVDSQKNFMAILRALRKVEGVHLVIAGDGPDRKRIENFIAKNALSKKVELTGWVHGKALQDLYRDADCFISASLWEGMPNTALEAMASGLPLVLSKIPGHCELVSESKDGFLFDAEDSDGLRRIIARLRDDRSSRLKMGVSAREKAVANYDWANLADRHLAYFTQTVKNEQPPDAGGLRRHSRWLEFLRSSVLFLVVLCGTVLGMHPADLSVDQITYVTFAKRILGLIPGPASWIPIETFSYFIAAFSKMTGNFLSGLILIYLVTAFLYLHAMYWCLKYFIKDKVIAAALTIISIVPCYTLGMTYWGFAGFEYIKARILFMPLAPVVIRLFFQWRAKRKIWIPWVLCTLGGLLSLEAFYLLEILAIYSVLSSFMKPKTETYFTKEYFFGLAATFCIVIGFIFFFQRMGNMLQGGLSLVTDAHHRVLQANLNEMGALSKSLYVDYCWRAAYAAFWWTLFPPSLTDIAFSFFNAVFLLGFGFWGACRLRREQPRLFRECCLFIVSVVLTAYWYAIARVIGWKCFGVLPHTFEEVRAFKFAFFPLFLFVGQYLLNKKQSKRYMTLVLSVTLLLISPLETLRALPMRTKEEMQKIARTILKNPKYDDYLVVTLGITDLSAKTELKTISDYLREHNRRKGERVFILSDRHELVSSGANVIMPYHDKRSHAFYEGKYVLSLPYWYRAYNEVTQALQSLDPDKIHALAIKYGCDYIVTAGVLSDGRFHALIGGSRYNLYEIKK